MLFMNWGMQELVTIMMLLYSILDMYGKQVRRLYILPFIVLCPSHRCCVHRVDLILCLWIEWIVTFYIVSFLPGAIFSLSKKHDMMKFPRNPKTSYTLPTKEQSSGKVTFHLTYVELIRRQFNRLIHEGLF